MRTSGLLIALCAVSLNSHAAPGDLDLSLGGTGAVMITFPGQSSEGRGIAVQPDGKIIAAGVVGGNGNAAVARLNQNGSLDVTFNGTGKSTASFGGSSSYINGMDLGANGRIVLAGYSNTVPGFGFAIARFDEDGFNLGNPVTPNTGICEDVALQADGKIVAVGYATQSFVIARYGANGALDSTFDGDGRVFTSVNNGSAGHGVAIQTDGKIVVAGNSYTGVAAADFTVLRYNPNGSLDTAFGGVGYVITPVGSSTDQADAVALQSDGKIVVAGYFTSPTGAEGANYALLRYNADGSLDTSFNGTGKATANLTESDITTSLAIQSDGKILVAGNSGLVRFNANGSIDTSFGTEGKVFTDYNVNDVAVQPDGQIVVSGADGSAIVVARFHSGIYPGLVVEQPIGTRLANGQSPPMNFGMVLPGETSEITFMLRNQGLATGLSGLAVAKTGAGTPGDYSISSLGSTSLASGQNTSFKVTFAPMDTGTRTAALELASNDPDDNPFVIHLTGTGATKIEAWRKSNFGSFDDAGLGANNADPDNDGHVNFLEYALGANPLAFTASIGQLVKNGDMLEFTYTSPKALLGEMRYSLESSASMSGLWISAGTTTTILSDDGLVQHVKVTTAASAFGKRFVRLRVSGM